MCRSLNECRKPKNSSLGSCDTQWLILGIFVQKVSKTNLHFRYKTVKYQKKLIWWTFEIDIPRVPSYFLIFYSWFLKLRFVSNIFRTKITKNSHSDGVRGSETTTEDAGLFFTFLVGREAARRRKSSSTTNQRPRELVWSSIALHSRNATTTAFTASVYGAAQWNYIF